MSGGSVDLDLLADYAAGVLAGTPEADRVAARLATDPGWQQAYDELVIADATVRADLRALAAVDPRPMPADVAAALIDRLSAAAATPDATVVPLRRHRAWYVAGGAVAAALVLVVAGSAALGTLRSSQQTAQSDAGGAAAPGYAESQPLDTGKAAGPAVRLMATGTAYTADGLLRQPDPATAAATGIAPKPGDVPGPDANSSPARQQYRLDAAPARTAVPAELAGLTDPGTLTSCLDAIVGVRGGTPVSVDYATFSGSAALVVVLYGGTVEAGRRSQAVVAGPRCGSAVGADIRYVR
jgi:hypothetical protein